MTIGAKLKTLRKSRKITQYEVAAWVNMSRATISNYEIGRRIPSLKDLTRLADFYNVSLDYFGVITKDEIFELINRAKLVFEDEDIPKEKKDILYKELMRLYLDVKQGIKKRTNTHHSISPIFFTKGLVYLH